MDALDRMFAALVRTIRASHPEYLTQPFEVGELYQTILPYRHFRSELLLETNQDYERTLLELLSGARGYLIVDDRMRDAVARELVSSNAGIESFHQFASMPIMLSSLALNPGGEQGSLSAPQPMAIDPALRPLPPTVRTSTPGGTPAVDEGRCKYCRGKLPSGRPTVFCPYCGQNLTVSNCRACGAEMEIGWKYCVACGRTTGVEE